MKRIISLILALCLLSALFCGCTGSEVREYTDPTDAPEDSASPAPADDEGGEADEDTTPAYQFAYEKFAPDTVVMTVDGADVHWDEFFYWMMDAMYLVAYYYGDITDWSEACPFDSSMTYDDYVWQYAYNTVQMYHSMANKAAELGITLTDENNAYLDELWNGDVEAVGSEEELIEQLKSAYLTKDLYYFINTISVLADSTFTELYGENGDKLTEEEIADYGEDNGYLRVKHILFKTVDDESNALSDDEIAAKKQLAEETLEQLRAAGSSGELEELFDQLMNENSEDNGLAAYPDGYCFTGGDMVAEFMTASAALGEYELSEIVTSEFGYHIILRLPLRDVDVPINDGVNSLRYLAATDMFNANVESWAAESSIVWADEFKDLAPSAIFSVSE